jgi:hypothetical protein
MALGFACLADGIHQIALPKQFCIRLPLVICVKSSAISAKPLGRWTTKRSGWSIN